MRLIVLARETSEADVEARFGDRCHIYSAIPRTFILEMRSRPSSVQPVANNFSFPYISSRSDRAKYFERCVNISLSAIQAFLSQAKTSFAAIWGTPKMQAA